jgi:hypothetical protein
MVRDEVVESRFSEFDQMEVSDETLRKAPGPETI